VKDKAIVNLYKLEEMQERDIEVVCSLIAAAMSGEEAIRSNKSFNFHFTCKAHGLDDGRQYYTCTVDGRLVGLTGLHHYEWGPAENVWLAWFAVHPDFQRQGIGRYLLQETQQLAQARGYHKLFIETYDHPDFATARQFYTACGFTQAGEINHYLPGPYNMIVYLKDLV
jgi:GNAT superfamily N-acetyltransferase